MKQLLEQLGQFWCTTMHSRIMWPIRGEYQCSVCRRHYPVSFEASAPEPVRRPEFRAAVVLRRA